MSQISVEHGLMFRNQYLSYFETPADAIKWMAGVSSQIIGHQFFINLVKNVDQLAVRYYHPDTRDDERKSLSLKLQRASLTSEKLQFLRNMATSPGEGIKNSVRSLQEGFVKDSGKFVRELAIAQSGVVPQLCDRATEIADVFMTMLTEIGVAHEKGRKSTNVSLHLLCDMRRLFHKVCGSIYHRNDMRYFAAKALREVYDFRLNWKAVSGLQKAANYLQDFVNASAESKSSYVEASALDLVCTFPEEYIDFTNQQEHHSLFRLLLDTSFLLGILSDTFDPYRGSEHRQALPQYRIHSRKIDAEYLLSNLCGFPIPNTGLDELFGGGGILLHDESTPRQKDSDDLPGRTVLIRGGYGSGKTLLSLTMAAEVARKGGVAIYFALEFTTQAARFALSRLGFATDDSEFRIFTDAFSASAYLAASQGRNRGALVILETSLSLETPMNFREVLNSIADYAAICNDRSPRLIVVDSLNALGRTPNDDSENGNRPDHRRTTLQALQTANMTGVNTVLIAEEDGIWTGFGEDIADTVIRLATSSSLSHKEKLVDSQFEYQQRIISIPKSRMQREHRGVHPFRIVSGQGFRIYLSSASRAAIDAGRVRSATTDGPFGFAEIDAMLNPHDLANQRDCGSMVLLQGKLGTYKTQFAFCFLQALANNLKPKNVNNRVGLAISIRYTNADVQKKLAQPLCKRLIHHARSELRYSAAPKDIWTCTLSPGFTYPDEIFQKILSYFDRAAQEDKRIDRVFLDNPGEWEDMCPLLASDAIFSDTLINFLRKRGVKILVTNRMVSAQDSKLIRAILEQVDTWIELEQKSLGGNPCMTIKVARSPFMDHVRPIYQLIPDEKIGLKIRPLESYTTAEASDMLQPIPVRILGRVETRRVSDYWSELAEVIRASITPEVTYEPCGQFGRTFALDLALESVPNSLRIIELDEFEMQQIHEGLADLPEAAFGGSLSEIEGRIVRLAKSSKSEQMLRAVPFYDNLGYLVYNKSRIDQWSQGVPEEALKSWQVIAEHCIHNRETSRPFFAFPTDKPENWNCLFLEVLAEKLPPMLTWCAAGKTTLTDLMFDAGKLRRETLESALTFHTLVNPILKVPVQVRMASRKNSRSQVFEKPYAHSFEGATVWRQWFTTLHQLIDDLTNPELEFPNDASSDELYACPLPGNVSVAGQWYLAILDRSIGMEAGIKFLQHLTSKEAEQHRLMFGIGMPTRKALTTASSTQWPTSPCLDLDFFNLYRPKAISRSVFPGYRETSYLLSSALRRIAALDRRTSSFDLRVQEILDAFCEDSSKILKTLRLQTNQPEAHI